MDVLIVIEEALEQVMIMEPVNNPAGFPDGMHAQHSCADIDSFNAGLSSQQRTFS
jgi:hypothetical protein